MRSYFMKHLNWRYSMTNKLKPVHPALNDYELFSNMFYSVIDPADTRLKTLTLGTALLLKERQLTTLAQYNGATIELQEGQSQEAMDYIRQLEVSSDYLIYPASRMSFFKDYFSQYSPLVGQALYDCMVDLNLIKGVGAGRGYASLIKPPTNELTQEYYQSFINSYNPEIIVEAVSELSLSKKPPKLNTAVNYTALVHHEIFYYQDVISQLSKVIEQKDAMIAKLQNDNYITTQLTWR